MSQGATSLPASVGFSGGSARTHLAAGGDLP